MKIIMQVKHMAQFVNPADKPKNAFDLSNSKPLLCLNFIEISLNQGIFAFYRGNNALMYRLILQHSMQFALYETFF